MATKAKAVKASIVPSAGGVVRVSVPAKVAYNLRSFQKVQASILDRLGCTACCSGWDIRFDITRNFNVDEKLRINEMAGGVIIVDG